MKFPVLSLLTVLTSTLSADLTIPGMTAYGLPDANGVKTNKADGSVQLRAAPEKIVWYGQCKHPGELSAAVQGTFPKGHASKYKLTVDGQEHEASVKGTGEPEVVDFGKYKVTKAGYQSFALIPSHSSKEEGALILALQLKGPASEGAHFNLEERRNAASVHLTYSTEGKQDLTSFYNEVTAVTDPVNSYYMACGFHRGYFGMQVNSLTERRIIFSVWDSGSGGKAQTRADVPEEDQTILLGKGEGVEASAFGNEGTGGHSHLIYNWKTGQPQKFVVTAKPEGTKTIYSGYYFHPEKKDWMLIASFSAPHDGKALSGLYSFVEDFAGQTGNLQRKARFGPQWVQNEHGKWTEIVKCSFSHDPTGKEARLDRFMGVEQDTFFLSNGGFIDGFTKYGEEFHCKSSGAAPTLKLPLTPPQTN